MQEWCQYQINNLLELKIKISETKFKQQFRKENFQFQNKQQELISFESFPNEDFNQIEALVINFQKNNLENANSEIQLVNIINFLTYLISKPIFSVVFLDCFLFLFIKFILIFTFCNFYKWQLFTSSGDILLKLLFYMNCLPKDHKLEVLEQKINKLQQIFIIFYYNDLNKKIE
ncbi:hypothetical protein pb186bvf_010481 [Paramecium bursaria]